MRVVGYIAGALIVLVSLPFVILGIGALVVSRGFDVPLKGMTAPEQVVAIVSPEFSVKAQDLPSQVRDASVTLHIDPAAGTAPLFIGIAPSADVKKYLRNVTIAHPEPPKDANGNGQAPDPQTVLTGEGIDLQLQVEPGTRKKVAPPTKKDFWVRQADSASGDITLSIPDLDGKDVRLVVMRADGRPGMAFDATATVHIPILLPIGAGVLIGGIVVLALGAGLIVLIAVRGSRRRGAVASAAAAAEPAAAAPLGAADDAPPPAVDKTPEPPAGDADPPA